MNLRVSAKDLIPNHLTMSLFNHAEIWKEEENLWPQSMYTNGHVIVDAVKMSKSKVKKRNKFLVYVYFLMFYM